MQVNNVPIVCICTCIFTICILLKLCYLNPYMYQYTTANYLYVEICLTFNGFHLDSFQYTSCTCLLMHTIFTNALHLPFIVSDLKPFTYISLPVSPHPFAAIR